MATILVIDPDCAQASRLRPLLECSGFAVRHVASAFEALTLIERESPQVILSRWNVGEMTARELVAAVRSDDAVGPFKAVLALDSEDQAEAETLANGTFDLVLAGDETTAFATKLCQLLGVDEAAPDGAEEVKRGDQFSITGFFGLLDLADLVQTVCSRRKTGALELECGGHSGSVVFEAGMVRHARYRGSEGKRAFSCLFAELRERGRAPFSFQPMTPAQVAATPRTIDQPAQLLLLEIAVAQDESARCGDPGAKH